MSKCTPQYNDETRRLMKQRDELRRVAKAAESGDFGPVIRAKAKELTAAGETDAQEVLRQATENVNQYAPHTEEEVSNAISGYGKEKPAPTRDEARERLAEVKRELLKASREKAGEPTDPAQRARLTALKNERAELEDRFARNDFERQAPRGKKPQAEQVLEERRAVNQLKRQLEDLYDRRERMRQPGIRKFMDFATAWHMFSIFTSYLVYPKLAAAVVGGHGLSLLQGATVSGLKAIWPAFRRIAEQSGRHGAGLTVEGLQARLQGLSEAPKEAVRTFMEGESSVEAGHDNPTYVFANHQGNLKAALDVLTGDASRAEKIEAAQTLLSSAGRSHGFIKTFLSHPEYRQSFVDRSAQLAGQLKAKGMSDADAQAFMQRPSTLAMLDEKALQDAYESKMQGKNKWHDWVVGGIQRLDRSPNLGAKTLAFALKWLLPVVRVGPNVVKQGTSLIAGGVKAAFEAASKGEMTPDRADYIVKNIGQQGAGAMLVALGMVLSKSLGGVPGAVPKGGDVKADEAHAFGIPIGAWGFHGAPLAMMQIGAGIVKVFEAEQAKERAQGKTPTKGDVIDHALTALGSNVWNWAERTLPETDQLRRASNTLKYGRGRGKYGSPWGELLGGELRSAIPIGLQQAAQATDPYKGFRRPRNIGQDLELGVPGLREKVPEH